ncbi:hypothetical protein GQ600_9795 [Phytophthora cactorum]|nr:hypothetical protein GQ600_9795 [Phytophthora cactorum]
MYRAAKDLECFIFRERRSKSENGTGQRPPAHCPRLDDAAGVLRGNEVRGAKQLWNHRNAMTEYHVWVAYRTTTAQLNLFHPGRPLDNSCLTLKACSGHKKPLQHIFWDYKCARDSWQLIIGLWMGCAIAEGSLTSFSIIAQRDERHQCQRR